MHSDHPEQPLAKRRQVLDAEVSTWKRWLHWVAKSVRTQLGTTIGLDDLVSCGWVALLEAEERFDPNRGVSFQTFAYPAVQGAMRTGAAQMSLLGRRTRMQAVAAPMLAGEEAENLSGFNARL